MESVSQMADYLTGLFWIGLLASMGIIAFRDWVAGISRRQCEDLQKRVDSRFDSLDKRLDWESESRKTASDRRYTLIEQRLKEQSRQLHRQELELETLRGRVNRLTDRVLRLPGGYASESYSRNGNAASNQEEIIALQGDVKELNSNVLALRDKTDRIERDMEATRNLAVPAR